GLCPQGWHLPRLAEWNDLANALGGFTVAGKNMKLGSAALWPNASLPDQNTFNVTPAGEHYIWKSGGSAFGNRKKLSKFWTTRIGLLGEVTIIEVNSTNGIGQNYNVNTDPTYYSSVKSIGYSCRCVED
ncbi:MAG: FISUMP domain-containing protein, partial [Saprospiraceae bacterium]